MGKMETKVKGREAADTIDALITRRCFWTEGGSSGTPSVSPSTPTSLAWCCART